MVLPRTERAVPSFEAPRFDIFPYLLMLPGVALVVFATCYPVVFVAQYSLFNTHVYKLLSFAGLDNYRFLLSQSRFWENFGNTLVFVLGGVALCWFFGISLAILLRRQGWANAVFRAIVLVPWVTNQVVLALMWKILLSGDLSPLNDVLAWFGMDPINPFVSLSQALPALTIINAWRGTGFAMLLMLAGLAAIPHEIDEAADIDGASAFQQIRYIILPLLKPISLVCMVTLTISFFNVAILPLALTGGGPLYSTELLSVRLYREGFENFDIALASTLTVILVFVELILAGVYFRLVRSGASK